MAMKILDYQINHDGVFVWEHSFGGSGDEEPHSIEETSDDGLLLPAPTLLPMAM